MRSFLTRAAAGDAIVAIFPPVGKRPYQVRCACQAEAARPLPPAMRRKARQATKAENRPRFWGRHAVAAALANPERETVRIWVTREAAPEFDIPRDVPVTFADAADLGRLVPRDAPHQGIVAEVERLPDILLADVL